MKEYGELLADDVAYSEKALEFSLRVRDISELLADLPFERPSGGVHAIVTYQDSCHLAHAQRITRAPRHILESIPGLRFAEMAHPDRCCGSAGVYSLTQPQMSMDLLDGKMADIAAYRRRLHRHLEPRLHGAAGGRRATPRSRSARRPRRRAAGPRLPVVAQFHSLFTASDAALTASYPVFCLNACNG